MSTTLFNTLWSLVKMTSQNSKYCYKIIALIVKIHVIAFKEKLHTKCVAHKSVPALYLCIWLEDNVQTEKIPALV